MERRSSLSKRIRREKVRVKASHVSYESVSEKKTRDEVCRDAPFFLMSEKLSTMNCGAVFWKDDDVLHLLSFTTSDV